MLQIWLTLEKFVVRTNIFDMVKNSSVLLKIGFSGTKKNTF